MLKQINNLQVSGSSGRVLVMGFPFSTGGPETTAKSVSGAIINVGSTFQLSVN